LALALRELGRVERTLFTLDWLRQPELRRRAYTGLNKGELRNALAKALRFYRRGVVADRDREEQQRNASGLNLVIAAISLWNTVYLQKATTEAGNPVPEDLIPHLSPLGWEHITFTGPTIGGSMRAILMSYGHFGPSNCSTRREKRRRSPLPPSV